MQPTVNKEFNSVMSLSMDELWVETCRNLMKLWWSFHLQRRCPPVGCASNWSVFFAPAEVVLSMLRRALPSTRRLVGRTFSTAEQAIAYVGHRRSKISRLVGAESQKKKGRSFWTSRVRIPIMRSWNPANLGRLHGRRNGRDDCSLAGLNAGCGIVRINFDRQGVLRYWCQW